MTTAFAVVIGVAFIAGSYILSDTIFAAFDEIFSESLSGTSVVVSAENPVEQENGEIATISASLLPRIQRTPGVKLAAGAIFTPGGFFDAEGDKIGNKFAPKFISSTLPGSLESLNYVDGHRPRGPTEASIDRAARGIVGPPAWRRDRADRPGQGPQVQARRLHRSLATPPSAAPASPR